RKPLARFRNFYGPLSVGRRTVATQNDRLTHAHGRGDHGFELQSGGNARTPTAHYAAGSGLAQAFRLASAGAAAGNSPARRISAGGLGVGTVAAYARPGDSLRFYEINPQIVAVASDPKYFTYLSDSPAQIQIVPGDGRLSLEREADRAESSDFDLLVLDAFSG